MHRCVQIAFAIAGLTLAMACGRNSLAADPLVADPPASTVGANVQFDHAIMKATHNAYARDEPLFDQLVYHRIRSVELDIHAVQGGRRAPAGDWLVYHEDLPFFRETSCGSFSECLGQIAAFHTAVPLHEIVTVFVDLKDDFVAGHSVAELDRAITDAIGRDGILAPADLLARCPGAATLRDAVNGACRFPTLAALRGKILFAVTGGTLCDAQSHASQYAISPAENRIAFVAPELNAECPIERYDLRRETVFLNVSLPERQRIAGVRTRGLVARVYHGGLGGGLNAASELADAEEAGAQILATDRVNAEADPWSSTASIHGGPFRCKGCGALAEPGDVVSARAATGSLDGVSDSFFFAHDDDARAATWSTFVSVPGSHVERNARACLMARASDAPDAAHVALCRAFDRGAPTLVVRGATGAATTATELDASSGLTRDAPAFLRLTVTPAGDATDVLGEVSSNGRVWTTLAHANVASALPLHGLAVASSGSVVKALFGNLTRTTEGAPAEVRASSLVRTAIGAAAHGNAIDGFER